jgi:hypothetical protein
MEGTRGGREITIKIFERVQDTNRMLERKEKKTRRKRRERNAIRETSMPVRKWKDWKQKEDGQM